MRAVEVAELVIQTLVAQGTDEDTLLDIPQRPPRVLHAVQARHPDGSPRPIRSPLTPLLDTTVLTNAPGEPAIGHELQRRDRLRRLASIS